MEQQEDLLCKDSQHLRDSAVYKNNVTGDVIIESKKISKEQLF